MSFIRILKEEMLRADAESYTASPKDEIKDPGNMVVRPYKKVFPPFLIMRSFQRASRQRLGKPTSTAVPAALLLRSCSAIFRIHRIVGSMGIPIVVTNHIPNLLMNH